MKQEDASAWGPFKYTSFTILWVATVISNIGTWMNDIGSGWLMTELDPSPTMVSAVQAATALPVFLFAILAGAIADIVDRRKMLLWVNIGMLFITSILAILVSNNTINPLLLLLFTFLMGAGAAFMGPAWQAIVPTLVNKANLPSAIALNSMGINISRAIGPAIAGFLIVSFGIQVPFILNAISIVVIIMALIWWKSPKNTESTIPKEHTGGAILSGIMYVWNSNPVKATLIRAAAFFLFASAYWAMLPLIAREVLQGGPSLYGILLGSVGIGAVVGALVLPKIYRKLGPNKSVLLGTIGTSIVLIIFALSQSFSAAIIASALAGMSWIAVLSSLHMSIQTALPNWVRARGLSIFLTIFFGSMALGSIIWGQVATMTSIQMSLLISAILIVIFSLVTWRAKLGQGENMDLTISTEWPTPQVNTAINTKDKVVMIQIQYQVPTGKQKKFHGAMNKLSKARKRLGAYHWTLMQNAENPEIFIENWLEHSWENHLRHHEHVTQEDTKIQQEIRTLTGKNHKPIVTHYLSNKPNL